MITAVIILGLAALGGLTMAIIRLRGAPLPPTWLALVHGAAAATGVGILIYLYLTVGLVLYAKLALGIFILAALGGLVMFLGFHLANKALPVALVVGHGLIAATGYVLLLLSLQ
jgi:hypothetical protein